jgi:hypothetical protein
VKIFRALTRSGNRLAELIRNRLVELSKNLLPTNSDVGILMEQELFNLDNNPAITLKNFGGNHPKTLAFPNFKISNSFPNYNIISLWEM